MKVCVTAAVTISVRTVLTMTETIIASQWPLKEQRMTAFAFQANGGLADGAVQSDLAVGAVRDGGAFASVRGWAGNAERGITFHRTMVRTYDHRADLLDDLRQQAEAGVVTLRVAATYPGHTPPAEYFTLEAGGRLRANAAHARLDLTDRMLAG